MRDSGRNDITTTEWLAYVARDPELSLWPVRVPEILTLFVPEILAA
jgi:hypothetical protein